MYKKELERIGVHEMNLKGFMKKIKIKQWLTYRSMADIDGGSATNSNSGGGSFGTTGSTTCGAACLIIWRKTLEYQREYSIIEPIIAFKIAIRNPLESNLIH